MCENCKTSNNEKINVLEEEFSKLEYEYLKNATKIIIKKGFANVDLLQKNLVVGYSRAARIIDQLEEKQYIEPSTGKAKRKVLITPEQFREDFGEEYNS